MPVPDQYPDWATNTNYDEGPDVGTETKTEPSAGRKADGWRRGNEPPAQEFNWWKNLVRTWIYWLHRSVGRSVSYVNLAAEAGELGQRLFVFDGISGWYQWFSLAPFTPDEEWVVTSTVSGFWVHEAVIGNSLGHYALVGSVPGDPYPSPTPNDRLNPALIYRGTYQQIIEQATLAVNTTSGSATTLWTGASHADFREGDVVHCTVNATIKGNSAANFNGNAWMEVTEDGGSTWVAVNATIGSSFYRLSDQNTQQALTLGFTREMPASVEDDPFQIRIRGISDGTNEIVVNANDIYLWVTRP